MESSGPTAAYYIAIINRRKWSFFIPCIVVIIFSVALALFIPPVYKSVAKIMIEKSDIRADYVKEGITTYAGERVRSIEKQILSSHRLKEIIEQHQLYPDLQEEVSIKGVVNFMRQRFIIDTTSLEARGGGRFSGMPTFELSYEDNDPIVAQQVVKLLTTMFLEENIKLRKRLTSETTLFLEKEIKKLETELKVVEGQINNFKRKHVGELPSQLQINLQSLRGIESKKERLQEELLKKRDIKQDLFIQLATIPKDNRELSEQKNLIALETRLSNLRSQYTEAYPDVIKLKAELDELKQKIYAGKGGGKTDQNYLSNPTYVAIKAQLSNISHEIDSLIRQIEELGSREDEYQKRIETTLSIEDDYIALINKRRNTQAKHDDLVKKLMDAKVSYGLEVEQMGERFTLVNPANYPKSPYKPNRLAIILLGCLFGAGLGIGNVAIKEYRDHSIRNGDMLENLFSEPVLGCIPVIFSEEKNTRMGKILLLIGIMVPTVSLGIFLAMTDFESFNAIESIGQFIGKINEFF